MKVAEINKAEIQKEKDLALLMQTGTENEKQNAFNYLYQRHNKALFFKVIRSFKMDKEMGRDLVQEIFMKVFQKIDSYSPEYAFSTWLYKIANNHIIDRKRQQNFEVLNFELLQVNSNESSEDTGAQAMVFQLEDKSHNNHELLVRKERAEMVHQAIEEAIKTDLSKQVIRMVFMEDLAYEDISKKMNISEGKVKTIVFRAKEALKVHLSKKKFDFTYEN